MGWEEEPRTSSRRGRKESNLGDSDKDGAGDDLGRRTLSVAITKEDRTRADRALALAQIRDSAATSSSSRDLYVCEICDGRSFEEQASYSEHMKNHRSLKLKKQDENGEDEDEERNVGVGASALLKDDCEEHCGVCDLKFISRTKYSRHMFHHKVREREGKFGLIAFALTATVTPEESETREVQRPESSKTAAEEGTVAVSCSADQQEKESGDAADDMNDTANTEPSSLSRPIEYICKICKNRTFTNQRSFDSHQKYHARLRKEGWSVGGDSERHGQEEYVCEDVKRGASFTSHRNVCEGETDVEDANERAHSAEKEKVTASANSANRNGKYDYVPYQSSYTCEICGDGRSFAKRLSYINHLRYHEKQNQAVNKGVLLYVPHQESYQCSICGNRKFLASERESFLSHLGKHAVIRRREGRDRPIQSKEEFTARQRQGQPLIPDQESYRCEICPNRVFNSKSKARFLSHLAHHRRIRQTEGRDRPILTTAEMKRAQTLKAEERRAILESSIPDQESYSCGICPARSFTNKVPYIQHLKHHEWIKQKEGADRPILSVGQKVHKRQPLITIKTCSICPNRTFSKQNYFRQHMRCHEAIKLREGQDRPLKRGKLPEEGNFHCSLCNRNFSTKRSYFGHKNYHRNLVKRDGQDRPVLPIEEVKRRREESLAKLSGPWHCELCDLKFEVGRYDSWMNHLRYHEKIREKEGKDRPLAPNNRRIPLQGVYTCNLCEDRIFLSRQSFIEHMQRHRARERRTGEAKFRKYQKSAQGPSSWVCEICSGKKFNNYVAYRRHVWEHRRIREREGRDRPMDENRHRLSSIYRAIPDQDSYTCDLCPQEDAQVYPTKDSYYDHLLYHWKQEGEQEDQQKQTRNQVHPRPLSARLKARNQAKKNNKLQNQSLYRCIHIQCVDTERTFRDRKSYLAHLYNHVKTGMIKRGATRQQQKEAPPPPPRDESPERPPPKLQRFDYNDNGDKEEEKVEFVEHQHQKTFNQQQSPLDPQEKAQEEEDEADSPMTGEENVEQQDDSLGLEDLPVDLGGNELMSGFNGDGDGIGEILIDSVKTLLVPGPEDADRSSNEVQFIPMEEDVQFCEPFQEQPETGPSTSKRKESHPDPKTPVKQRRSYHRSAPDGNYFCGYCGKRTVAVQYIKTHTSRMHPGLPLNYRQVLNGISIPVICDQVLDRDCSEPEPSSSKAIEVRQTKVYPSARKKSSVEPAAVATIPPAVAEASTSTSLDLNVNVPQPEPSATVPAPSTSIQPQNETVSPSASDACTCPFVGTVLSTRKGCSEASCPCYSKQKQCSSTCGCRTKCGNPFQKQDQDQDKRIPPAGTSDCRRSALSTSSPTATVTSNAAAATPGTFLSSGGKRHWILVHPQPPQAINISTSTSLSPARQSQSILTGIPGTASYGSTNPAAQQTIVFTNIQQQPQNPAVIPSGPHFQPQLQSTQNLVVSGSPPVQRDDPDPGMGLMFFCCGYCGTGMSAIQYVKAHSTKMHPGLPIKYREVRVGPKPLNSNEIEGSSTASFSSSNCSISGIATSHPYVAMSLAATSAQSIVHPTLQEQAVCSQNPTVVLSGSHFQLQPAVSPSPPVQRQGPRPSRFCGAIYRCFCGHDSYNLTDYLKHQWTHRTEELFLCPVCRQEFPAFKDLIAHAKARHTDGEAINLTLCTVCEALLSSQEELTVHYAQNHPVRILCDVCHQSCGSIEELNAHRGTHPTCSICKKVVLNQIALRGHFAANHMD